jgi:protein gp37
MSDNSNIEWTDSTWNPVRGCSKVSAGCKHCYAETFSERFRGVPGHPFEQGFDVRLVPDALDLPRRWRSGRLVFVNSMSDLFQDAVPTEYIHRVFSVMRECPQHQFQVLTKRAERLLELGPQLDWAPNVWMGVSVENADFTSRVRMLQRVPAAIRFVSVEPLLGPIARLPLKGIHWVIVGGESGHHAREMKPEWARSIRDQCQDAGVPFFFKQWGGVRRKVAGRQLDRREWNELPVVGGA